MLWWILTRTRFEDGITQNIIRDAFQSAPVDTLMWLRENAASLGVCSWCFATASKRHTDKVTQKFHHQLREDAAVKFEGVRDWSRYLVNTAANVVLG